MEETSTVAAKTRHGGILLHPTSLPGQYGIGTLGREAYKFVDWLADAQQSIWQILPLGPTGYGDSPYQCFSAYAGNPLLIDMETLVEQHLLDANDLNDRPQFGDRYVQYGDVINWKMPLLQKAFKEFSEKRHADIALGYEKFCTEQAAWLNDYALYRAVKDSFGGQSWTSWDDDIRLREPAAIEIYSKKLKKDVGFHKFIQYLFFGQWKKLKEYANKKDIKIVGDIPIYISLDSVDAWSNPDIFMFDKNRKPTHVAGVPPDYFSATGQLWGNPLYDWKQLKKQNFVWWIDRIKANLELYDIIRVDHFRAFESFWSVPADATTAIDGKWMPTPGKDLFKAVRKALGTIPIIAEDLGVITPEVEKLRDDFEFPGMKILHFAFYGGDGGKYLPHTYIKNCIVYTGTHDNDTTVGWFNSLTEKEKDYVLRYANSTREDIHWGLIRLAWSSAADTAIVPLQDVLGVGAEGRMNTPSSTQNNWGWRFKDGELNEYHTNKLKELTELFQR